MKIDGACHCGKVSYVATVDPERATICHCADCQAISGAPFRANVPVAADKIAFSGTPKIYVRVADSGNRRAQAFCGDCGASLYSADAENPASFTLRLGAVKQRAALTPRRQIWCASAMPWVNDLAKIPGVPGQS